MAASCVSYGVVSASLACFWGAEALAAALAGAAFVPNNARMSAIFFALAASSRRSSSDLGALKFAQSMGSGLRGGGGVAAPSACAGVGAAAPLAACAPPVAGPGVTGAGATGAGAAWAMGGDPSGIPACASKALSVVGPS